MSVRRRMPSECLLNELHSEDLNDWSVNDIVRYKCARLVSCDVKSTFSQYSHCSVVTDIDLRTTA